MAKTIETTSAITSPSAIRVAKTKISKTKKLPKTKEIGRDVGRSTGLTIHAWWGYILWLNEEINPTTKTPPYLTDEELSKEFYKEFPKRDNHQPISRFRSWYNNGTYNSSGTAPKGLRIQDGIKPTVRSQQYVILANPSITNTEVNKLPSKVKEE